MDLKLSGQSVLITGASRGIGYACAEAFLREGCSVTLVGSRQDALDDACDRLLSGNAGAEVDAICSDLAAPDGVAKLSEKLRSSDIVVNNAGAVPGGGLDVVDDARWRAAWDLKVFSYINVARQALPVMMERGSGVIVNVVGMAGVSPQYDFVCVSAGNAALNSFTKAVGAHAARHGVRVLGVNPGPTTTERLVDLFSDRAEAMFGDRTRWPELFSDHPFGRAAHPEEIADLVAFIASPRASYLSGVMIDADGGAIYNRK